MHSSSRYTSSPFSLLPRSVFRALGMLLLGGCLAAMGLLPGSASAQTVYTVDATGDGADANVGDGTCATSGGDCTLRAALQEANATSNSDEIEFAISGAGPHVIQPQSALPTVSEPVIIDATSEPDYNDSPVVELDGQNAGSGTAGLTITRASTVQGLAIINFDGDGLVLDGSLGNTIQSNYIGVAANGSAAGNGGNGLTVENGSSSSLIGPDNVISNNSQRGIFIGLSGADDNTIYGNRIGTSPDGMSAMGNGFEGVLVNEVTGTTIGGTSSNDRNIISGNGRAGIQITSAGATSNTVSGNYIGVASDGTTDLGNAQNGVEVTNGASSNTIGGSASGAGNVISGNTENGVLVTGSGTSSNTVLGNNIGTNDAGDSLLGNDGDGVAITSGATATIGGTADGAENVIGGNEYEIYISTSNNTVQGNFLGTNADGDDLGSSSNAIRVDSGSGNLIGGSASGAGNVIAFTATNSVVLFGSGNTFQGNYIGTNPAGDNLSAAGTAVRLFGSGHAVGGTGSGEGNTIANNGFGVSVESGTGHAIRGNAIFDNSNLGLDFNRDGVTPNDAGDGDDGVNRLQNFPEIQSASYDADADEVTVTYQVPSDPDAGGSGASAYDLTVDFYRADLDGEEGEAYLGTDTYTTSDYNTSTSGPDAKTITFTPDASVAEADSLLATATDANGNTSEFSADAESLGPNVFTVDATGDGSDADAGDGTCATSGGDCTLRAALEETNALANLSAGPDEIHFDISGAGPHTILPQSALPEVTDPVVIDGSTEPDFSGDPVIALDGSSQSGSMLDLETGSDGSSVLALSIINVGGQGLFIRTDDNLVDGCWIGLSPDGADGSIASNGIRIFGSGNQIGTPNGSGNVIVNSFGIDLSNDNSPGNTIQNNLIGETPSGTAAGNFYGVSLGTGIGGVDNTIGGTGMNEGNVIAHNDNEGVMASDGVGSAIRGNRIVDNGTLGIDLGDDGTTANDAGDGDDGVNRLQNFPEILSASYDTTADEVTVTYQVPSDPNEGGSGASAYDLTIDFYRTGTDQEEGAAYLGSDTYTTSDYNTSTSGPDSKTITFTPADTVSTNSFVVATATDANSNTSEFSATAEDLGPNVFTVDATGDGSDADAGNGTCATSNGDCTLRAALQETNALANAAAGPDEIRFDISGAGPHTIVPQSGLPDVTDPVVIDGSTEPDFAGDPVIAIDGSSLSTGTNLLNLETGSDGSSVLALSLINSPSQGLFARTDSNRVDGCWIGLAPDGTVAGITSWGFRTFGSSNQIGDPDGSGNVIVGAGTGIDLSNDAPGNTVQNNLIGQTPSGDAAGNGVAITLGGGSRAGSESTIGGTGSNEGNVIAHSNGAGVVARDADMTGTRIRGNRLFANGGIGIDLGDDGVTPNDAGDTDDGENRLQNFPEIQSASYDAGANEVTVTYQVPSDPDASGSGASAYPLTVDLYKADADDEEGAAYLGTDTYTASDYNTSTSGPDSKTITFTPDASVTESDHVVATATDANGNTSEFSAQSQQLPVDLTALEAAQADNGTVALTWQVASEQNNAGFAVQHQSSSSDTWTKLGFVESTAPGGTTAESQSYRYSATDLAVGTHRFRLKQVDLDGSTTVTDPVTVELTMNETLRLSAPAPNPIRTQATLSFAVKTEAETVVTLYNVLGQQVRTLYDGQPTAGEAQRVRLDATGLSSGVYIVRLKAQGQTRTRRVTVVR